MIVLKVNPVAFPTFGDLAGKGFRSQRMQTATTQIFYRYPSAKNINPLGGKTACLIQHARVATLALDDDDSVGRSESFKVNPHLWQKRQAKAGGIEFSMEQTKALEAP